MTISFWLDRDYTPRPPLLDVVETEYVVIGGGITGISFAYHLALEGKQVVLLEADLIASKATGRSAGFLLGGVDIPYVDFIKQFGNENAEKFWNMTLNTIEYMKSLCESHYISADFELCEAIKYTDSPIEIETILNKKTPNNKYVKILTEKEVQKRVGKNFIGGVLEKGAMFDPVSFVRGIANVAEDEGAHMFENTLVIGWVKRDKYISVETSGGLVKCKKVIVCTNSYIKDLVALPINSVRGQMLATDSFPRKFKGINYSVDGWLYFTQNKAGNLILGGGREIDKKEEETDKENLNLSLQEYLVNYVGKLSLSGSFKVINRWSGIMGFTPDRLPIIGEVEQDIHVAVGFSGHGNVLGFLTGKEYTNKLVSGSTDMFLEPFDPKRFTT